MRQFVGESVKQSHSRHSRFPTRSGWPSNHLHLLLQAVRGRQGNWMKVKKWSLTPAEWWDFSSNSVPSDNLLHAGSLHTWHAGTIGPSHQTNCSAPSSRNSDEVCYWERFRGDFCQRILNEMPVNDASVCVCSLLEWLISMHHISHSSML